MYSMTSTYTSVFLFIREHKSQMLGSPRKDLKRKRIKNNFISNKNKTKQHGATDYIFRLLIPQGTMVLTEHYRIQY